MPRISFLRKMIFDGRGRPPPPARHRPNPAEWSDQAVTGSCSGHSTVLLNFLGARVLTDPVFSQRVGPGIGPFILGPKRYQQPALPLRAVPAPDVILLSHAHFDHFDVRSLRHFPRTTPVVTAAKTKDLLRRFKSVHELAWGESVTLTVRGRPLRVESIPVAHWGARMMRDTHRGYGGYVLERDGRAVCFAGDTAYTDAFNALRTRAVPIDLALMPIGAYDPWIRAHCTPEQAVAMAEQAGARYFVPIHHQTFKLSNEPMDEPARRLRALFSRDPRRLLAVDVGETFRVPASEAEPSLATHAGTIRDS
jgi:L-ascorbate metabolism protein UlaG (beta-lactamase superfamily)